MSYNWGRGAGGAASGALAGAEAGSVVPGIGTAIGAGIGGIAGAFGGFGDDDEAGDRLKEIPGTIKPYYQPSIDAGNAARPGYQEMMRKMMENPDEFINQMGQGYQQSPGYKWNLKQGENAITNANAAGGMAGSPQHEQQNAEMASGLASKDYNEYMNRVLSGLGIGATGTGGLIQAGDKSSGDLATSLAGALGSQANLGYAQNANNNQQNGQMMGNILGYLQGRGKDANRSTGGANPSAGKLPVPFSS